MATLTPATQPVKPFNCENLSADLLARCGFRLPEPITPPPADKSPGGWPTWDECRKSSCGEALDHAVACAEKLLRAYPPGEAPEGLEARLETLLNRAFRERRVTTRGKLGAERPALPDMRKGRMKPLPVDEVPGYRIVTTLCYVNRTETQRAFLDGMRGILDLFERM